MKHRFRYLTFLLPMTAMPGVASAQTVIAVADLPAIRLAAKADYGLKTLGGGPDPARSHGTPMLERLFAPVSGFATTDHHHVATFEAGSFAITTEAMRQRLLAASNELDRKARVFDRVWAAGIRADWAVGANDRLSLGAAATRDRRAEADILPGTTHIKGSVVATELSWSHDDHLRLSLGWRADSSSSPSKGAERLVELAQGAALQKQGFRLTVSYALPGSDPSRGAMFGIAARDARVAAADLSTIGAFRRQDMQAALFFRSLF